MPPNSRPISRQSLRLCRNQEPVEKISQNLLRRPQRKKRQRRIELAKLVRPLRGVSRGLPNLIADVPLGKPQHNAFVNAFPACCPAFQTSRLLPMSPR
ncbi:hypothetical protein SLA2020_405250 [Shorea laevis]